MKEFVLASVEELMKDAQPCTIFKDVQKEINESELPFPAGHAARMQRDQDWSILGHQVVGAETF
jgi:hypothetical protein